ncbi:hypothetical protein [Paenibacillus solani]|uniref:hypothetical protein n=1 Tax=Paenibacillus solani TaxID=1705565 RepID=UPI001F5FADDB|nr:hypothetical protein [Paenibacillus solani]
MDSTHIKANASIGNSEKVVVEKKPSEYFRDLEQEAHRIESELNPDPNKKKRGKSRKKNARKGSNAKQI